MYVTCRFERTPHMLLDFADVLRVNVFTLGAM
jgi:transcription factor IIIB subunit 2